MDTSTVNADSISAFGRMSGPVTGSFEFTNSDQSVIFNPDESFSSGDLVSVLLSHDLVAADGLPLRDAGYSYQFWTAARRVFAVRFVEISELSARTDPGVRVATYGGVGTDLDNDGFSDITVANEHSEDLRTFMNRADGTGLFAPYITPTTPANTNASPTDSSDFNGDGNADVVVGNKKDNSVSIVLGNGDGTFAPQQEIMVGELPAGVTVLDINGDGHVDIANTNVATENISLLLNDGSGVFGAPTFYDTEISRERSVMAGDMNNDGISDLVVGGVEHMRVLLSNGDGTFDPQPLQSVGAVDDLGSWQIMLGDVNGDGNLDVSTVNARANNGAILFGDGNGSLSSPDIYNLVNMGGGGNRFTTASDFGDWDGDGDLDWITSSAAGSWLLQLNDGTGNFDFFEQIDPHSAASCALVLDIDNDGDLDLALIDEVADVVFVMQNVPEPSTQVLATVAVGVMLCFTAMNWRTN